MPARLDKSIRFLDDRFPELSASRTNSRRIFVTTFIVAACIAVALVLAPLTTTIVLVGLVIATYVICLTYKLYLLHVSRHARCVICVGDEEARAIPAAQLPVYTVLVPAFKEPESIRQLLDAIDAIEYPHDRLDVKLLLEADDHETIGAARAASPKEYVEVITIPPANPRTKPKALNYGLIGARGELVTIYDAEDVPEPLQLRRAVQAFSIAGPNIVCLQARLGFYNAYQNLFTKWFTLEYRLWFSELLPGIVDSAVPVPLGGTSNHFRMTELAAAGGWDPYNVTEDADLGIRLARMNYKIGLLDSETGEEATSDFVNWVKQRSRWYKGYFQTWLVHLRRPRTLLRELGPRGFFGFMVLIGGTPLLAACNVTTWALTFTWLVARPGWISDLFPAWIYYVGLACFVIGNAVVIYLGIIAARSSGNHSLAFNALLIPIYWLMMSVAAFKAAIQLVFAPSFWEKTVHGMARAPEDVDIDLARLERDSST
jgi:cellulose synthase/poly-beta-1,6-N-acetylglucosamine synthase-like glycosyltransferase